MILSSQKRLTARVHRALTIISVTIAFSCAANTRAQCTLKITALPASSELFGFRLGMTKEEVKVLVPQTAFGHTDEFGVTKTTINPYFDPKIDTTKFANVRSISLDFVDEHLTSVWIGFDENYKVRTIDELVKLLTQSLHLSGNWSSWKSKGQQLQCGDFQLIVTTVAGGPSFRLLDTAAEDLIAMRRQEKEERDAAADSSSEAATSEIIGDKHSKLYYSADCPPTKPIADEFKVTFKSIAEALKAGFRPGKACQ